MPVFSNKVPGTSTKYKILWFVVDMYHRERYFFICGCKQAVTKAGVKSRRQAVEKRQFALV
jgi:hypothetical protein